MQQDLGRTFPSNAWVSTAEGMAALRRVLLAFSAHSPRIGYCQSMNFLAAALLLALGQAEDSAFWVLVCLIDDGGVPSTSKETCLCCKAELVMRLPSHQATIQRLDPRGAAVAHYSCCCTWVAQRAMPAESRSAWSDG